MLKSFRPSRFNYQAKIVIDGEPHTILYNSYTGAIGVLDRQDSEEQEEAKLESGFIVPNETDELERAAELHAAAQSLPAKHLVIMPTEACNFRCTYCYQAFPRASMPQETVNALKSYVRRTAASIEHLSISWFGGEPLLAADLILELSDSFMESCKRSGTAYSADISTNGFLLTPPLFIQLLDRQIGRFMITLDGIGAVHDRRRPLASGRPTYDTILSHLKAVRSMERDFTIDLRVNVDEDNSSSIYELLDELASQFGQDRRFQLLVRPVGKWGGANNDHIPVCDRTEADRRIWDFAEYGIDRGLALSSTIEESLLPAGSVCYAAKPNSLVIGSDGSLYKCSIALDEPFNQLGRLKANGDADIDLTKMSLWTDSGEKSDSTCRSCAFRPACQGNHCPLYRMRTGKRPCPHEKRKMQRVLKLIWKNHSKRIDDIVTND